MKKRKLAVLGGDNRGIALIEFLSKTAESITVYGINESYIKNRKNIMFGSSLYDTVTGADAIILPLPVSGDGVYLNCRMSDEKIKVADVFDVAGQKMLLGGRFSPLLKKEAENRRLRFFDYFESEELQIENAVLVAEGALNTAMNRLDVSIFGSRSAIIGYGRIGKALLPKLISLGSDVTVAARKSTDLTWASSFGCKTLKITADKNGNSTLKALGNGYDVVFNTVPVWLFNDKVLNEFDKNTLFIDLASSPGGLDPKAVEANGITVIHALSLPGRYAPRSAGILLGKYINDIITAKLLP